MVNFRNFSNHELVKQTKFFTARERESELLVLRGLREIEDRRLHFEMGYPSLEKFLIDELGYHSATAYRKVDAMRLIAELPEIEHALQRGEMNVTALSQAQSFFKSQARKGKQLKPDEKSSLLESIKGQSKLETEKLLRSIDPEIPSPDKLRAITANQTEIRFVADDALLGKLQKVRELTSHTQFDASYNALFHKMADLVLKAIDPALKNTMPSQKGGKPTRREKNKLGKELKDVGCDGVGEQEAVSNSSFQLSPVKNIGTPTYPTDTPPFPQQFPPEEKSPTAPDRSRYIKTADRRLVWRNANAQCSYTDPVSKRRCTSRWKLQIEHCVPFAKNGANHAENLTLLCAAHNRLAAIQSFGSRKMNQYLRPHKSE